MRPTVLAVTGLLKEAQIAAGPGVLAVSGGGSRAGLEGKLDAVDVSSLRAVVSFGIAGALDPGLRVGDVVLGTEIRGPHQHWLAAPELRAGWSNRLRGADMPLVECALAGVDAPLLTPAAKRVLLAESAAGAVDMESHVAAAFAVRHGLPFGAIRVISDRADHVLPPAAAIGMRPDGSVNVVGVIGSLSRDPRQLPALLATARDAAVAFQVLRRVGRLLAAGGGLLGLDLR